MNKNFLLLILSFSLINIFNSNELISADVKVKAEKAVDMDLSDDDGPVGTDGNDDEQEETRHLHDQATREDMLLNADTVETPFEYPGIKKHPNVEGQFVLFTEQSSIVKDKSGKIAYNGHFYFLNNEMLKTIQKDKDELLTYSIILNDYDCVMDCLKNGANPLKPSEIFSSAFQDNYCALAAAVRLGRYKILEHLLNNYYQLTIEFSFNNEDRTIDLRNIAVYWAVVYHNADLFKDLIRKTDSVRMELVYKYGKSCSDYWPIKCESFKNFIKNGM